MKIIVLSDLSWNREAKALTKNDLRDVTKGKIPNKQEFLRINFYKGIIEKENADIVLFCGDVTGDGSCGHGYTIAFLILLQILENNETYGLFIAGDHDEECYYSQCVKHCSRMKYIQPCDGRQTEIEGITFLGLSFQDTNKKTRMTKLFENSERIDILFSHCEHKRRISLFNFKTDYIITGHFDNKVAYIDKKVFISLSNDTPTNYATIEFDSYIENVNYYWYDYDNELRLSSTPYHYSFGKTLSAFKYYKEDSTSPIIMDSFSRDNYLINKEFEKAIDKVIRIKKGKGKLDQNLFDKLTDIQVDRNIKISKTFLLDYFGKKTIKKIKTAGNMQYSNGKKTKYIKEKLRTLKDILEDDLQNYPSKVTDDYWVLAIVRKKKKHPRKYTTHHSGKWLIFEDKKKIDKVWQIVKKETEQGNLGKSAKCSTANPNLNATFHNEKVICVYTYNWMDVKDVYRVEKQLRKIGITQALYYKTDSETLKGKYRVSGDKGISRYISKAVKTTNKLSLYNLHNVGFKKRQTLRNIGIISIDDLLKFDTSKNLNGKGISTKTINKLKLSALSQIEKSIFKTDDLDLPNDNIIYFDIETDLSLSYADKQVWFIGIYHNGKFKKFFARTWKEEKKILSNFLEYIYSFNDSNLLSYSGTSFDRNVIAKALERNKLDYQFFRSQPHYDVCSAIKRSYVFPTQSYGLKEVGKHLKYKFKNDYFDGLYVAMQYQKVQLTKEKLPREIFDYVEDDVKAIHHILQELNSNRHRIKDLTIETEPFAKDGQTSQTLSYNDTIKSLKIIEKRKKGKEKIKIKNYIKSMEIIQKRNIKTFYNIDENDFKCPYCDSQSFIRNGKTKNGKYRYKCNDCNKSFSSIKESPKMVRYSKLKKNSLVGLQW